MLPITGRCRYNVMKHLLLLFSGLLLTGVLFTTASCHKNTDCKARVKVLYDSTGTPAPGAHVLLFAQVKITDGKPPAIGDVKAEGNTGGDGTVEFIFELPAIFDVHATQMFGATSYSSAGIIKLEEGETVEKTLTLKSH